MVSISALVGDASFLFFKDPDGLTGMAVYRLGKWRGIDRWRGHILHRRRSKRPYLAARKIRIPVVITSEVE